MAARSGTGCGTMRHVILFAIVAFLIAGAASRLAQRFGEERAAALPDAAAAVSAPAAGPRTVAIRPDARGHFRVAGAVDGRRMEFLVDTGASVVALRAAEAARLGIHPRARDYSVAVNTANGAVRAAPARLGAVEVGGIMIRNVEALVMPDAALGENLLGLSFLSRLRRWEYGAGRLVLEE